MPRTNQKHLEAFEEEGRYWIEELGLKDFEVAFVLEDHPGIRGQMRNDYFGRNAVITLTRMWTDEIIPLSMQAVRDSARHEVIELVIADLVSLLYLPFKTEDQVAHARESAVKRIEKVLERIPRG